MAEIFSVQVQVAPPKGTFHGQVVEGRYIVEDGWVVLTNHAGEPVRDDESKEYKQKLEGNNHKQIAGLLTRKFRRVLRGHNAPPAGFGAPIHYPNKTRKKV